MCRSKITVRCKIDAPFSSVLWHCLITQLLIFWGLPRYCPIASLFLPRPRGMFCMHSFYCYPYRWPYSWHFGLTYYSMFSTDLLPFVIFLMLQIPFSIIVSYNCFKIPVSYLYTVSVLGLNMSCSVNRALFTAAKRHLISSDMKFCSLPENTGT